MGCLQPLFRRGDALLEPPTGKSIAFSPNRLRRDNPPTNKSHVRKTKMTTKQHNQVKSERLTAGMLEEALFAMLPELEPCGAGVARFVIRTRDLPWSLVRIELKAVGLPIAVPSHFAFRPMPSNQTFRERRVA